jgi:hypothetical protein
MPSAGGALPELAAALDAPVAHVENPLPSDGDPLTRLVGSILTSAIESRGAAAGGGATTCRTLLPGNLDRDV